MWYYLCMTQTSPGEEPRLPAVTGESAVNQEVPFSLVWLNGVDPRTFTPETWKNGRETTVRLIAGDDTAGVNVYRVVNHLADGEIGLTDEAYVLDPGTTEAGDHEVSRFEYTFDPDGNLTGFDPNANQSKHTRDLVTVMSGLVHIVDSTITARNHALGREAKYRSDGTQWIEVRTGSPAPTRPAIAAGQLALDQAPSE